MTRSLALGLLLALLVPAGAASATIILLRDDRQISDGSTTLTPPVPFQDWDASITGGGVSAGSLVRPKSMRGVALAGGPGSSRFDITFESTTGFEFELLMTFGASGPLVAEARIEDGDGNRVSPDFGFLGGETQYDDRFGPGVYRILLSIGPSLASRMSYEFALELTPRPIPEPGSALLFAAGVLAVLRPLRRR